jgi:hypothetical protein
MSRRLVFLLSAGALALLLWTTPALATTYYVSSAGSDAAAGTSQGNAWRTVGRVNSQTLAPGDNVLFESGATFGDATLMPRSSGSSGSPITFSSFGSGRATIANTNGAVWFSGKNWLVFDNVRLTSAGSGTTVFAGGATAGSGHITLSDSVITGTNGIGVTSPNSADNNWTISGNTITQVGDSGLIMFGGPHTITRNVVSYTGGNTAITWGKHGIYSKGPDQTISYNDFSNDTNGQAISIRYHGARVFGNTIHDTPAAFAFFDYDPTPAPQGTSYIYGNRAWNITDYGFYYDNYADPNGHAPTVEFVIASNTFQMASSSSEAVNVSPAGSTQVLLVNNVFTGTYGSALRKSAATVEHHNLWYGAASNVPSGTGDVRSSPNLTSSPDFAPNPGSPVVDGGAAAGAGVTYTSSCDGTTLSYCGSAPDLGAVETAVVGSVPLAPPSALVATNVAQTTLALSWSGSGDPRTGGYEVMRNGAVVASPVLPIANLTGLACGTAYTFSVRATGSATTSSAASTSATTAACAGTSSAPSGSSSGTAASSAPTTGGGGGGVPPEIAVGLSFGPTPHSVGDQFDYRVSLVNNSIQGADQTALTVKLPAGVQYLGSRVDRGPGCTPTGQTLTCNLDFFPGKLTDVVSITVKVVTATELTATASLWTLPGDSNLANNTASATVTFGAAPAAAAPATLGSYVTPAPTKGNGKSKGKSNGARSLQAAPQSGTVVKPKFLVVAAAAKAVSAVAFVLDGRSACVDRVKPFTCALKAKPGWHTVRVRAVGGTATTVRLRVAA